MMTNPKRQRRAALMVVAIVTLAVASAIGVQVTVALVSTSRQTRRTHDELQAAWLAESALERAIAQLGRSNDYTGETWRPIVAENGSPDENQQGRAEIEVETTDDGARHIAVRAHFPDDPVHRALAQRELLLPPAAEAQP